jgi:hypothetical protein
LSNHQAREARQEQQLKLILGRRRLTSHLHLANPPQQTVAQQRLLISAQCLTRVRQLTADLLMAVPAQLLLQILGRRRLTLVHPVTASLSPQTWAQERQLALKPRLTTLLHPPTTPGLPTLAPVPSSGRHRRKRLGPCSSPRVPAHCRKGGSEEEACWTRSSLAMLARTPKKRWVHRTNRWVHRTNRWVPAKRRRRPGARLALVA